MSDSSRIKVIPLGGLEQIGMNMTAFEYNDGIIVVDCGLSFPDDEMLGIDCVIPDITFLLENKDKVKGFVITHGHEDHIGALPYVLKEINVPIYATKLTMGIIEGKLSEHDLLSVVKRKVVKFGQSIHLGDFRIRKYIDNPAFTTDVIVGFPGETEEDYISSREFVKKVKFAELHVFKYSKRDGTVAAKMPNQIDEKIKTLRSEDLIKTGEELTKEFRQAKIGQDTTVLFEEKILLDNKEYWVGHTVDYIKIAVPEKENLEGQIRKVNVKDFLTNEIMLATM